MEISKKTMKKIMWIITYTILLTVVVFNFDVAIVVVGFIFGIIAPFLLGCMIAFVLNLPMKFFENHIFTEKRKEKSKMARKLARPVSLVLALIAVLGVLTIVIFVVVPELANSVMNLGPAISAFMPKAEAWIKGLFPDNQIVADWLKSLDINWSGMISEVVNFLKNGAGDVLSSTFDFAMSIINSLVNFFIGFIFAIYVLIQKEKLRDQTNHVMEAFLPEKVRDKVQGILQLIYKTFGGFITGQCLEAVILGSMFFIVLSIIQFPYALLIGVLVAFMALIPIFGAFIACIIGAFLILMVSPIKAVIFIGIFLVIQQIEGNLIYPHVVGGSVGLPSIWVLVAVTLGGGLMGIIGMITFIPLVSVVYTIFRGYVRKRLQKARENLAEPIESSDQKKE